MIKHEVSFFGKTKTGEEVRQISLSNSNGMTVKILTYGCTIQKILLNGTNVVLGYDDISSYENGKCFLGAFVGRYANRIGNASFDLNGKSYKLPVNDNKNHLHGVFPFSVFDYSFDNDTLILSRLSKDMEEGYPGNLKICVLYTLNEENALKIQYIATTDKDTVINLTNHSYFNLNGDGGTILEHTLLLDSDAFTPTDSELIPTGEISSVEGTPMDFRKPKKIGQDIRANYTPLLLAGGYDHNFVLKSENGQINKFATLTGDKSGIRMDCFTDQCGVQFYSGNFLWQDTVKKQTVNGAVCFETQHYPDSPNKPQFPSTVLKPGETYNYTTVYQFSF